MPKNKKNHKKRTGGSGGSKASVCIAADCDKETHKLSYLFCSRHRRMVFVGEGSFPVKQCQGDLDEEDVIGDC